MEQFNSIRLRTALNFMNVLELRQYTRDCGIWVPECATASHSELVDYIVEVREIAHIVDQKDCKMEEHPQKDCKMEEYPQKDCKMEEHPQ
jgi:hypothetical protein